jgi:hypothetical protein
MPTRFRSIEAEHQPNQMTDTATLVFTSIGLSTSLAALYNDTEVPEFRGARGSGAADV